MPQLNVKQLAASGASSNDLLRYNGTNWVNTNTITLSGVINADGGVDRSSAAALAIGATNATTLNLGRTGQTQALLGSATIATTLTIGSTASSVGIVRLPNNTAIGWRNQGNNGDATLSIVNGEMDIIATGTNQAMDVYIRATTTFAAHAGPTLWFDANYQSGGQSAIANIQGAKENGTSGDFGGELNLRTRVNNGSLTNGIVISSAQKVTVGNDIDRIASGTMTIGGVNVTTLTLGQSGQTQALAGNATVAGTFGGTGAATLATSLVVGKTTSTGFSVNSIFEVIKDSAALITLASFSTAPSPQFTFLAARGTFASPSGLQGGDTLGYISFVGRRSDGVYTGRSAIYSVTTEAWGASNHGNKVIIATTPTGSDSQADNLTVENDGKISFANNLDRMVAGATTFGATNITTLTLGRTGQTVSLAGNGSVVGTFDMQAAVAHAITTVTTTSTLDATQHTVLVDASGGAVTINLPAVSGVTRRVYVVKKIDSSANAVIIDPNGSENIDGALTYALTTQWQAAIAQTDGSAWYVL